MAEARPDLTECTCSASSDNLSDFPDLQAILPADYDYTVCNYKRVDVDHFECRFRVNVSTETELLRWREEFSYATNTDFNRDHSVPDCEEAIIIAARCAHTTEEPPRKYKNVAYLLCKQKICPTRLVIIMKLPGLIRKHGSHDVHCLKYPTTVIYHQQHNHLVEPIVKEELPVVSKQTQEILDCLEEVQMQLQMRAAAALHKPRNWPNNAVLAEFRPLCLFSEEDTDSEDDGVSMRFHDIAPEIGYSSYRPLSELPMMNKQREDIVNSLTGVQNKINEKCATAVQAVKPKTRPYSEVLAFIFPPKSAVEETHSGNDEFLLAPETESFSYSPDPDSLVQYVSKSRAQSRPVAQAPPQRWFPNWPMNGQYLGGLPYCEPVMLEHVTDIDLRIPDVLEEDDENESENLNDATLSVEDKVTCLNFNKG